MLTCEYKFRVQLIFVASSRELNGAVMMQSPPFTLDHLNPQSSDEYGDTSSFSMKRIRPSSYKLRCSSGQPLIRKMPDPNRATADDFEEHVESTAVPGKQSTKGFPSSAKPNACKAILTQ
jgi:hypothetical protein